MKIRKVKNQIIRRHLRLDAKNNKRELKLLRLQKGTPEQLELYKICIPMKWTKVSEDGEVLITLPTYECRGRVKVGTGGEVYYVEFPSGDNSLPFRLAGVDKLTFSENVLGYNDRGSGTWPWMKSTDDILKVLVELDRLYVFKEPEIEKPKSMETEHPSIEDIDFTPKKKHYSFNFQM